MATALLTRHRDTHFHTPAPAPARGPARAHRAATGTLTRRTEKPPEVPPMKATAAQVEEVVKLHGTALHRYCLSLTRGDRSRAEEIKQETLIRAWKNPQAMADSHRFDSFRPWLFTVARRISIDAERARKARPQECDEAVLALIPEPECGYERLLDVELVRDALASLSEEHRAVIHCLHFRSLTGLETAQELGLPLGTVKSRSHYALRALQHALEVAGLG
ncbi:sigma-70 family RNA polymerase sigma factor [Streptomyces sp. NPDC058579]|uniref:sigma-70 family RNA polymerase sigma factor n=1 Tax=Streptomyces sp. NPDC058579 TaxID=3346548 RepID=UPI00365B3C7D